MVVRAKPVGEAGPEQAHGRGHGRFVRPTGTNQFVQRGFRDHPAGEPGVERLCQGWLMLSEGLQGEIPEFRSAMALRDQAELGAGPVAMPPLQETAGEHQAQGVVIRSARQGGFEVGDRLVEAPLLVRRPALLCQRVQISLLFPSDIMPSADPPATTSKVSLVIRGRAAYDPRREPAGSG